MINRVRLRNFKGFQQLDLSGLSRITLIGGRNNIGKSSLLEAIFLFYDSNNPGSLFRHLGWRNIQVSSSEAETLFAPVFYNYDLNNHLGIEINDDVYHSKLEVSYEPRHFNASINVNIPDNSKDAIQIPSGAIVSNVYSFKLDYQFDSSRRCLTLVVRQSPANLNIQFEDDNQVAFPESMKRPVIYLPLRMRVDPQEDAARFGKLDIERKNAGVLDFLKVLEPDLKGLSSISLTPRSEIYADLNGMRQKIPVALLGDGMSRLLSVILAIATSRGGIVMIDEIDAGLHYSALPKIWQGISQAAKEYQCQIIATTHSYECLQAAYEGVSAANMEREFNYFRLEKQDNTVVGKQYTASVLGTALSQGWEVR
jgi:Predicted ATPases